MTWRLSSSSDPEALALVDGLGAWDGHGEHYSRRTPGSVTFTGVGQEVVLVTDSAVWACIRQALPAPAGSGASRGRTGQTAPRRFTWRNSMFRNLGAERSSDLIREAVAMTARQWVAFYGDLPTELLTTEIRDAAVKSEIPGYCYRRAGWVKLRRSRGCTILRCPRPQIERAAAGLVRLEQLELV